VSPVPDEKLELDDLQHFLLTRTPALAARYEFLSFLEPAAGRGWLAGLIDKVGTASTVGSESPDSRWVSLAFTWNGLRALGLDEAALASFPEEFRQGMAARAHVLGLTGANHPDRWQGHWANELGHPAVHAIVVLFARDIAERDRSVEAHARYLATFAGVKLLSSLDLQANPPFDEPHEHFGYRDRLSIIPIAGSGQPLQPGSGPAIAAGEFFLGYVDESGVQPSTPTPEVLSRNGSYLAYLSMQQHVGAFREFLRSHADTPGEQELLAAKLMGRWRSGAPLVLAPTNDDRELANDMQRTNDFNYGQMDPHGYACPVGAHIRRVNPRDTVPNIQRHRMIRRGSTYGPPLPEDAPEDGVERGIASFLGCASLIRQFELAMNVWTNDPKFMGLDNERDPIIGTHDGTFDMTIPARPIRKKIEGLPAFTTVRSGAYFFLPGIRALRFLASLGQQP
jgi:deferrochelatase/peroxidase EfeB